MNVDIIKFTKLNEIVKSVTKKFEAIIEIISLASW